MAQTKMSARYIATGSSVFSPALKAGVGVVGVSSRSTPDGEGPPEILGDERAHPLRLPVVRVVVAGAQHVGADQDAAPHLGPEPLAAGGLVERADVALGPDRARPVAHAVVARQVRRRLGRRHDVVGRDRVRRVRQRDLARPRRRAPRIACDGAVERRPRTPGWRSAGKYSRGRPMREAREVGAAAPATAIGGRSSVVASSGSCPLITLSTRPASSTVRPNTEMQSSDEPNATRP